MKELFVFSLFVFCALFANSQNGFLSITSDPTNAEVILDDSNIGHTPISTYKLAPGYHKLMIQYKNYEAQSITVIIKENVVEKLNITLKKSNGFIVKPEETSTINQAKGALTIITDPDNSDITIDGTTAEQKTPLTISEIGAGNHTIRVTNYIYINGEYKQYSIEKEIHIRPNKTELLEITFSDYFGSVNIKSIPSYAEIEIDNIMLGSTPTTINNLSIGTHYLKISAYLESPYSFPLTIVDTIDVKPQQLLNLTFDFYKKFKTGKLFLQSNNTDFPISILNTDYDVKRDLFSSNKEYDFLSGNCTAFWDDIKKNQFNFTISSSNVADVYIPIKEKQIQIKDITEHIQYFTFNDYLNKNYHPLPESEYKKILTYWQGDSQGTHWGFWWGYLGFTGIIGSIVAGALNMQTEAIVFASFAGFSLIIMKPFGIDDKKRIVPKNIKANEMTRNLYENYYNILYNKWQQETDSVNSTIRIRNQQIQQENDMLPNPSVKYRNK